MRAAFIKAGIACLSIFVSLAICELLIRIIPLGRFDKTRYGLVRPHLTRGFEFIPNLSKKRWGVDWKTNSSGFRDYDHRLTNTGIKIVALGDSFFVGNEVSFEDSFLRQLEKNLKLEVIKLAVTNYGTIQERQLWQEEGKKYGPKIVLLGVFAGNDLDDNVRFADGTCVYKGSLVPCGDSASATVQFTRFLARHSLLGRFVLQRFHNHLPAAVRAKSNASANGDLLFKNMNRIQPLYEKEWPDSLNEGFLLMKENITKLDHSVSNENAKLIVVIIPTELQIYDWQWDEASRKFPSLGLDRYKVIRLTVSFLEEMEIRYINLLPTFKKASETDQNLHPEHWHWSVAANKLVARTVEDYLRKESLVPLSQ